MTTKLYPSLNANWRTLFAFIVPSLIGVFLFMTPIPNGEGMTIPIAKFAKELQMLVAPFVNLLILTVISITVLLSFFAQFL